MNYPIELQAITSWLVSRADSLAGTGITLAETAARSEYVPAARTDFNSDSRVGRINFWVTGEVDFEVLDRADGASLFFRNETIEALHARQLDEAYAAFIVAMAGEKSRGECQNSLASS